MVLQSVVDVLGIYGTGLGNCDRSFKLKNVRINGRRLQERGMVNRYHFFEEGIIIVRRQVVL